MLVRKLFADIDIKSADDVVLYEGVAVTSGIDRLGERIDLNGLELDNYMRNPVLLFNHDPQSPIGIVTSVKPEGDRLVINFRFASTPKAKEVQTLVDEGVLKALSVGFISKQQRREGNVLVHSRWELLEISIVSIPANPEALIKTALDEWERKGATPFEDLPVDEEHSWDADESESRYRKWVGIESNEDLENPEKRRKYRMRFFWWDGDGTSFGGYKLPFVDIIDGRPKAVWRGIVAAMAALLGARGGVDIPDADKKEVYNHIAKYYKKVGKEPPEFHKAMELIKAVKSLIEAAKLANKING